MNEDGLSMNSEGLGLFMGQDMPTKEVAWSYYEEALRFNNKINLEETVRVNENFYIGKQWEGVQANGLPTPQFNVLKRVTGFTVATMTSDNLRIQATPLAAYENDEELVEPVRVLNEEFERIVERNCLPKIMKEQVRDSAVRGDGATFTYWDDKAETGQKAKGAIVTEMLENTRCLFGNPNDRRVQTQPWLMVTKRETVRSARKRAKENGIEEWKQIISDEEEQDATDSIKKTYDKVTTIMLFWKDEETGEVWCYEFCHACTIRKPWNMGIRLYPITWLNWDYVADCYHGQAMITGLIPNQIFINKAWAMSMNSIMRSAFPKVIFDKTRIARWDNRVGGAIGVAGNVAGAAQILDPAQISTQVFQFITAAVDQTEESLGATQAALGEGKAYNTSAILSLQRAASTPTEMTKQNEYTQMEDLARIYLEFMAENYGKRMVDMPIPEKIREIYEGYNDLAADNGAPAMEIPEIITVEFDFSILKNHPMSIKIDVGASSYYSEMASLSTLDNLLLNQRISTVQYLERIPDDNIAGRRKLIDELKQQEEEQKQMMAMQQAQAMMAQADAEAGALPPGPEEAPAGGGAAQGQNAGGAPATGNIAENDAVNERRTTGYKELGKALRRIS